jgi:prepilin-type N-terminal cleavage/methylation domain-containing protein
MTRRPCGALRSGLTLIEVIVSLAIFLMSLVAIVHLVNIGSQSAVDGQLMQDGVFLAQSKMAEFQVGAETLSSQNDEPFKEDDKWTWSANCQQVQNIAGLWQVEIIVSRARQGKEPLQVTLTQMILDPTIRGSTLDPVPVDLMAEESTEGEAPAESTPPADNTQGGTAAP